MQLRKAKREDLPAIVQLLADDELGAARERFEEPLPDEYLRAFKALERQEGNMLLVAEDDRVVIGCLQLTFIAGLSRLGATRAQIEGVRVARAARGRRIGEAMVQHAIGLARAHGCVLVQLTSDRRRVDAQRFYERLGFVASHVGMKLELGERAGGAP